MTYRGSLKGLKWEHGRSTHIFKGFCKANTFPQFVCKKTISLEITAFQIFFDMSAYKLTATSSDSYFPII